MKFASKEALHPVYCYRYLPLSFFVTGYKANRLQWINNWQRYSKTQKCSQNTSKYNLNTDVLKKINNKQVSKTKKQASKQTNEQANKQANKENKQAARQASKRANRQINKQTTTKQKQAKQN